MHSLVERVFGQKGQSRILEKIFALTGFLQRIYHSCQELLHPRSKRQSSRILGMVFALTSFLQRIYHSCQAVLHPRPQKSMEETLLRSHNEITTYSFIWTIENFSHNCNDVVESPIFETFAEYWSTWVFSIYPSPEDIEDCYTLCAALLSCEGESLTAKIKCAILNEKNEEAITLESQQPHRFYPEDDIIEIEDIECDSKDELYFNEFVKKDFLLDNANGLLPGDKLTIRCEISMRDHYSEKISNQISCRSFVHENTLYQDMGNLLDSQHHSDVILCMGGREYPAHKAILSTRSKVFHAMFQRDWKEGSQTRVQIADMRPEVLQKLLQYIYTGKVRDIARVAEDLLVAADYYDLYDLKILCSRQIFSTLSTSTAADALILADHTNSEQLKAKVLEFINQHYLEVKETKGWKAMVTYHSHLLEEGFKAILNLNDKRGPGR